MVMAASSLSSSSIENDVGRRFLTLIIAASILVIRDDRDSFSAMWMEKNSSQALNRMPGFFCRCTVSSFIQIATESSEMFSTRVF